MGERLLDQLARRRLVPIEARGLEALALDFAAIGGAVSADLAQIFLGRGDEFLALFICDQRQFVQRHVERRTLGPVIRFLRVWVDSERYELLPDRQHLDARHRAVEHVELGRLDLVERHVRPEA